LLKGGVPGVPHQVEAGGSHLVPFEAEAGVRYLITLRVGEASGETVACAENGYDEDVSDPSTDDNCAGLIAQGFSCEADFCIDGTCDYGGYCDKECGFECVDNGVEETALAIVPADLPIVDAAKHIAASLTTISADKAFGWTASASGRYEVRAMAAKGGGPLSVTIERVGTALLGAMPLTPDGVGRTVGVDCRFHSCTQSYAGSAAMRGDGAGFDLRLDAKEGAAYAFAAKLPPGQTAAEMHFTVYDPNSGGGAGAFPTLAGGPLGSWTPTPTGHESVSDHLGCKDREQGSGLGDASKDEQRTCLGMQLGLTPTFGDRHPRRPPTKCFRLPFSKNKGAASCNSRTRWNQRRAERPAGTQAPTPAKRSASSSWPPGSPPSPARCSSASRPPATSSSTRTPRRAAAPSRRTARTCTAPTASARP
jgi:hypothetical protein